MTLWKRKILMIREAASRRRRGHRRRRKFEPETRLKNRPRRYFRFVMDLESPPISGFAEHDSPPERRFFWGIKIENHKGPEYFSLVLELV
jgi:hypothetical protein